MIVFLANSGRLESSNAAQSEAPEEIPTRSPSCAAAARARRLRDLRLLGRRHIHYDSTLQHLRQVSVEFLSVFHFVFSFQILLSHVLKTASCPFARMAANTSAGERASASVNWAVSVLRAEA